MTVAMKKRGRPRNPVHLEPLASDSKEENYIFSLSVFLLKTHAKLRRALPKSERTEENYKQIARDALGFLQDPKKFVGRAKEDNPITTGDMALRLAWVTLRSFCLGADNSYAKRSVAALKEAGLFDSDLKHPRRRPSFEWLLYWQEEPDDLFELVENYNRQIRYSRLIDKNKHWDANGGNIQRLFQEMHGKPLPPGLLKAERILQPETIALMFICGDRDLPYHGLHRLYFRLKAKANPDKQFEPIHFEPIED